LQFGENRPRLLHGAKLLRYYSTQPSLNPYPSNASSFSNAIALQVRMTQIAGARAVNLLGLMPQVPTRTVYLTDEPARWVVLASG
ncbi:DUF6088 family protein, partial [Vineibacter terrae]|uniref:DUF6088 family protein n=1 Tax=Vineibacter terrae TaxID=2586908 RepID=UPI001C498CCA